jgi:hypothetical protein
MALYGSKTHTCLSGISTRGTTIISSKSNLPLLLTDTRRNKTKVLLKKSVGHASRKFAARVTLQLTCVARLELSLAPY